MKRPTRPRLAGPTLLQCLAHLARFWPALTTRQRLMLCAQIQAHLLWSALLVPLAWLGAASLGGGVGALLGFPVFSVLRAVTASDGQPLLIMVPAALGAVLGLGRILLDLLDRDRHWRARVLHSLHQQASALPADDGMRAQGGSTSTLAVVTGQSARDLGPDEFGAMATTLPQGRVPEMFGLGAVVLVMAATTIPSFISFGCRAKMSEAKVLLKSIHAVQSMRHAEQQPYGTLEQLTAEDERLAQDLARSRYYSVSLTATEDGYRAVAQDARRPIHPPDTDLWTMDATGELKHPMDGCSPD